MLARWGFGGTGLRSGRQFKQVRLYLIAQQCYSYSLAHYWVFHVASGLPTPFF